MGGSVAILGAAALADALAKHPEDLTAAFRLYDESFRPIAEAIQTQAVEFGLEMFLPRTEEAVQERNARLSIR
jgi:2-polyprenyl-6-methoxyphenol hydroxylase-like FAD-dependent oxidoreductase